MGRDVSTDLQNLLDLGSCKTVTSLRLALNDTSVVEVATEEIEILNGEGDVYTADLRTTDDLKQTVLNPPDRVNVTVQNVDMVFGANVEAELLTHSVAILGRQYIDDRGVLPVLPSQWVELFRGEAFPLQLDEMECQLEVLADLVAAGYCIADWALAENCQVPFKGPECAYSGSETLCNKKRRSPAGCQGRANEFHFVGMEFPDPVAPSAPSGGGGDPGDGDGGGPGGGGGWQPPCPRVDQYVLVRGSDGQPKPKLAGALSIKDWIFMPTTETFHKLASVGIVPDEEIWLVGADSNAMCYSSGSHPIIRTLRDEAGTPAESMFTGYSMLTFAEGELLQSVARTVRREPRTASVVRIHMADGHIYAAGNTPSRFVLAHNKPVPIESGN